MGIKVAHLEIEERIEIERLIKLGNSLAFIAASLGRSKTGIATEVRKNGGLMAYSAKSAQNNYVNNKKLKAERVRDFYNKNPNHNGAIGPHNYFKSDLQAIKDTLQVITEFLFRDKSV